MTSTYVLKVPFYIEHNHFCRIKRDFTLTLYLEVTYEITLSVVSDSHKITENKKENKNITIIKKDYTVSFPQRTPELLSFLSLNRCSLY